MKRKYIPWATILKEFNDNFHSSNYLCTFICHNSLTFKKLWENFETQRIIKSLAAEFLKENKIEKIEVSKVEIILFVESYKCASADPKETVHLKDKTRKDFLIWAAQKNKRKKQLQ
jgi:hypothetical protein